MNPSAKKVVYVTSAILLDGGNRIFMTKRPEDKIYPGFWEFPGGKIEAGESPEEALIREMKEEVDVDISPGDLTPFEFISHNYPEFHVIVLLYICRKWTGTPKPLENQKLAWESLENALNYSLLPANDGVIERLKQVL